MIEGMDGAGKGTIVDTMVKELEARGKSVFDIRKFEKEHHHRPSFTDVESSAICVAAEPTLSGIGQDIREHLIRSETDYVPLSIAHAYAVDREILYRELLVPARLRGIHCIEERGVVSSLVFQAIYGSLPLADIAALPGNAFALLNPPDVLVIVTVDPKRAVERSVLREKSDHALFEREEFQRLVRQAYLAPELRTMFEERGTKVFTFDTGGDISETRTFAKSLANDILAAR